ncbi:hypothetical protein N7468_000372 [Penicillium chermesinum]|uniref:NmrA-like domain-containing protein n=1 Tax=Penicillium chermesinum TaxID=63820 RepID=A0A9W9PK67_9EURO|nr:uncharacterized protein N7468_000372 [Penicillium chermesinum]KAJ5248921.1 hypothetical protein N7468_000372 [Penicillium chermesinum]KAJ6151023.1 hypothetical protein N7470_007617 [Penicillium chermesinum]
MSKLITVFGATGNQGGSVIRTILNDQKLCKEFRVRGVTRDVNKPTAKALAEQGVEIVQGDLLNPQDVATAVKGADTVFLVTNFWEYFSSDPEIQQGKIVADACKEAGVKHLIFSSLIDASKTTNGRLVNITHFDGKAEVERYIRSLGIPATFVMLGVFMSELFTLIQKGEDGSFTLALPVSTKAPTPLIDASKDTGNFVRAALVNPPKEGSNTIHASAGYYTPEQIGVDFEAATGKQLAVVSVPGEVFKSFLGASMPPHLVLEVYENLLLLEEEGYYAGADLSPSLNALSEKPVTLKEFFTQHKEKW